jgi:hypothetical protein
VPANKHPIKGSHIPNKLTITIYTPSKQKAITSKIIIDIYLIGIFL